MALKDIIEDAREALGRTHNTLKDDSAYYEAKVMLSTRGAKIPQEVQEMKASVGWSRLYLDSLVARIGIDGFRLPNSTDSDERLMQWWKVNALDQEAPISFLETLIHGRSFIAVSAPTDEDIALGHPADAPIITVESPNHMWVDIDQRTKRVKSAVRFYFDPSTLVSSGAGQQYTVYLPNETMYVTEGKSGNYIIDERIVHNLGIVPIIPSLNRERVSDRWGRSEIIPELRSAQDIATQVMVNMRMASDLMAVPQRLLFGVEKAAILQHQEPAAQYQAYMAGILAFENKDAHSAQFSAAELSNYTNVLQELAKQVASYTGLPPQYLSFSSQTPASAEAIRSSESRLVKTCEMKGSMFGNVWERVMRLGMLVIDGVIPEEFQRIEAILADPSTPTYAAKADAAMKLVGGKPIIPVQQARIDMGYTPEQRENMKLMDEEENAEFAAALLGTPTARFPLTTTSAIKAVDPTVTQNTGTGNVNGNTNGGGSGSGSVDD
jgi:hypothetical protein